MARLGLNGAAEVKGHAFFATSKWKWDTLRRSAAPFVPEISSDDDTGYFDEIDPEKEQTETFPPASVSKNGQNTIWNNYVTVT